MHEDHAAAQPRGHNPLQAHEKGLIRPSSPRHIRRVAFPQRPDLERRRRGADAAHAATARYIARWSGGTHFWSTTSTPQVNIAYGAYYLRTDRRYGGNEAFALAAYNAGEGNVDRWMAAAQAATAR